MATRAKAKVVPVEQSKQFKAVVTTPEGNEFLLGVYNSQDEADKVVAAAQEQLDDAQGSGRPKHPRRNYRGYHGVIYDRDAKTFEAILELPHRGTEVSGGEYSSPEAAARAYDALVRMYASESVSGRDDVSMWGAEEEAGAGGTDSPEAKPVAFTPPLNFPQSGTVPPSQVPAAAAPSANAPPAEPASSPPPEAPAPSTTPVDDSEPELDTHTDHASSGSTGGEFSWVPPTQQRPHERQADPIPVRAGHQLEPEEVARALKEEGGVDVRVLDVRRKTSLAEHLVFVTGRTTSHMRRLADMVCRALRQRKLREWDSVGRWEVENRNGDDWMAVDCGNMVVNVFDADTRAGLNVEGIWDRDLPDRVAVEDADEQMERNARALATGALMQGQEGGASVEDLVRAVSPLAGGSEAAGSGAGGAEEGAGRVDPGQVLKAAEEGATLADALLAESDEEDQGQGQRWERASAAGRGQTEGGPGKGRPRKRFGRMKRSKKAALEKEDDARMLQWLKDNPISPAWERRIDAEMRADQLRTLDNRERRRGKRGRR